MIEVYKRLRLPEVHWNVTINKIPNHCPHKKIIRDYTENILNNVEKGQGLYLFGDYGTGKSAIGCICLISAQKMRHLGLFLKAKDVPKYVIENIKFDFDKTYWERAVEVPLLVIDEFQLADKLGFREEVIEDLVRARIDRKRATIITTNVVPKILEAKYPGLYSVIQESLYPVKIFGHDFRAEMKGKK